MEIKVSDCIGFCFGVKQAVDLSKKALAEDGQKKIFSIGPIIHNPQVVKELLHRGLTPVDNAEGIKEGTVIISSHGAGAKLLGTNGLKIIDATCPFVKKIQQHVKTLYKDGYTVVIIGKREHPEVKALVDVTDGNAVVIKDVEEAKNAEFAKSRIGVVSQSTYSKSVFLEVVSLLLRKPFLELRVFNTICRDTIKRQEAVRRLANVVDMMIVVGGRDSANTCRLVEVCKREGKAAYHIEASSEIESSWLANKKSIGVASGASTPDWVVQEAVDYIKASGPKGRRPGGRYC